MRAAARANTEQASKVSDVGADPPAERGRPPSTGKRARHAPADPTGVRVAARMAENRCATREVCPGEYDWLSIAEMPDSQADLAVLIAGASRGPWSDLKTTLAVTPEEFGRACAAAAGLAPDFKAAGFERAEPP